MKLVVSPLFLFLFFLTLSTAEILDHHHNHDDTTSSDGQDSFKTLLPTESSPVPDHTESSSSSIPVEEKEERQDVEITPDGLTRITKVELELMNRNPAHLRTRVYPYSFRVFRFNPRCRRDLQRFFRYRPRFIGVNEEGAAPVLSNVLHHRHVARNFPEGQEGSGGDELQVFDLTSDGSLRPRHHHHHHNHDDHEEKEEAVQKFDFFSGSHRRPRHHHHHDDEHDDHEDDQTVEMKTEVEKDDHEEKESDDNEEEKKENNKESEIKRDALKTIRKFLGY